MATNAHSRFYVDFPPEENESLRQLADALTVKMGIKVTKMAAIRLAVKDKVRKERIANVDSTARDPSGLQAGPSA